MHPSVIKEQPGKCPQCGMNLIPLAEGSEPMKMAHGHHQHSQESKSEHKVSGKQGDYYCPMLCEGDKEYEKPGDSVETGLLCPFFGLLLSPMLAALAMSLSSVSVIAIVFAFGRKRFNHSCR